MIRYDGEDIAPGMKLSCKANIDEFIWEDFTTYDNGDELYGLWYTEAVYDSQDNYLGHTYVMPYTNKRDPDGKWALFYGDSLYDDGMTLTDSSYADIRWRCFYAADIFYRHAAGKGNPMAYLKLGYVYYYDRCEGHYWQGIDWDKPAEERCRPFPREERTFQCFKKAAEEGLAEGAYKLGDVYKNGIGCIADEAEAYRCYIEASHLDDESETYLTGSIALRLAICLEEGVGCSHDFRKALSYYGRAEEYLEKAVDEGVHYYQGALRSAQNGITRCKQEIALEQ